MEGRRNACRFRPSGCIPGTKRCQFCLNAEANDIQNCMLRDAMIVMLQIANTTPDATTPDAIEDETLDGVLDIPVATCIAIPMATVVPSDEALENLNRQAKRMREFMDELDLHYG